MLQTAYAPLGGFSTAENIDELIYKKSGLWKAISRNGHLTAVHIYKNQFGSKGIGIASDGTVQGKKDVKMLLRSDIATKRMWIEVSGIPEKLYQQYGATAISSKFAPILTKHEILSYDPDGYHYTRLIHGQPKEKIIYGTVRLSSIDKEYLKAHDIEIHDLPSNIEVSG